MATLRCSPSFVGSFFLRSLIVAVASVAGAGVMRADDARPTVHPRPLMRVPRWLEALAPRATNQPSLHQPPATDTSSAAPQAPTAPAAAVTALPDTEPPVVAEPIAIPSTPMTTADGLPGRQLVRSRPDADVNGTATLTAGWTDLTTEKTSAQVAETNDDNATAPEASPTPQAEPADTELEAPAVVSAAEVATTPKTTPPVAQPNAAPATAPAAAPPTTTEASSTTSRVTVPVATPPDETPALAIDPASFRGVHPGKTTREELVASWGGGEAFSRDDGTQGLFWTIEPFERVEVTLDNDTVGSIRIKLTEPVAVSDLAKQLEIADLRTVAVLDEKGVSIGEVFPERGVIFSVNPGTQSAIAVMLEPLDPESFVLRAEGELDKEAANAVADLQYALQVDPRHLRALRLLLALKCEQGKWQDAKALADRAMAVDPVDVWTQLKLAGVLMTLEQTAEARATVATVLAKPNASPLVVAQGERMLGRIELATAKPDYQKAVEHFGTAIRTATPLVGATSMSVQRAARDVLLDAHLGTALAIAKGTWQQKARVIPKWITRSEAIVNELDTKADDKQALELQLCRGALAAAAGSTDSIDPLPWVKRLLEVRSRANGTVTDAWRRRQLDWEIGQGLADALLAAQKRGDAADMLENSTLTAAYLERGSEQRQLTDAERKNIGELMFRIGILHSLQQGDHATAVTWFDKALPLWDSNAAFASSGETGRLGEAFVSMAISYWQVERRNDAVAISNKGVDLMVQAVEQKQLDERSLAVAYGNLSTMYAEKGDDEKSRTYAEMASRAESSGTVLK